LYLAEGKKRDKLWASAVGYMQKLKIPQTRIDAIAAAQDIEALAKLVKELMNKK
jgi:deoxyadenosine/deoxycytidine kinase